MEGLGQTHAGHSSLAAPALGCGRCLAPGCKQGASSPILTYFLQVSVAGELGEGCRAVRSCHTLPMADIPPAPISSTEKGSAEAGCQVPGWFSPWEPLLSPTTLTHRPCCPTAERDTVDPHQTHSFSSPSWLPVRVLVPAGLSLSTPRCYALSLPKVYLGLIHLPHAEPADWPQCSLILVLGTLDHRSIRTVVPGPSERQPAVSSD